MNIVPMLNPRGGQRVPCSLCGRMSPAATTYADLDGPAYVAFYCAPCVESNDAMRANLGGK